MLSYLTIVKTQYIIGPFGGGREIVGSGEAPVGALCVLEMVIGVSDAIGNAKIGNKGQ